MLQEPKNQGCRPNAVRAECTCSYCVAPSPLPPKLFGFQQSSKKISSVRLTISCAQTRVTSPLIKPLHIHNFSARSGRRSRVIPNGDGWVCVCGWERQNLSQNMPFAAFNFPPPLLPEVGVGWPRRLLLAVFRDVCCRNALLSWLRTPK